MSCTHLTDLKTVGLVKDQLTEIHKALYLSVLMCGAPTWQSWLAATRLEQLERCQNRCDNRSASGDPGGNAEARCRSMQHDDLDAPADRHRLLKSH